MLVATVPLVAWAFAQDGLTVTAAAARRCAIDAGQALRRAAAAADGDAARVAGLAVGFLTAVHPPGAHSARARHPRRSWARSRSCPPSAILMLANAPGGIDGQLSKAWKQATDPAATAPANSPDRLAETSSVRARYWREALEVHGQPVARHRRGRLRAASAALPRRQATVRHAHGYVVQTLADLGWVGLGLSLLAAVRLARGRGPGRSGCADAIAGCPGMRNASGWRRSPLVAVVFGVHSTIDWTWFVPGNVVPALLCAGWVASRTPLRERLTGEEPVARRRAPAIALRAATAAARAS